MCTFMYTLKSYDIYMYMTHKSRIQTRIVLSESKTKIWPAIITWRYTNTIMYNIMMFSIIIITIGISLPKQLSTIVWKVSTILWENANVLQVMHSYFVNHIKRMSIAWLPLSRTCEWYNQGLSWCINDYIIGYYSTSACMYRHTSKILLTLKGLVRITQSTYCFYVTL